MTRAEFVELHRHEIAGLVLEALTLERHNGAKMALFTRNVMRRIDDVLGRTFDSLPAAGLNGNGKHSSTVGASAGVSRAATIPGAPGGEAIKAANQATQGGRAGSGPVAGAGPVSR